MIEQQGNRPMRRVRLLIGSLLLVLVIMTGLFQTISAQEIVVGPPELENSTKIVDKETARDGDTLTYSVIISNSGSSTASEIWITDTLTSALTLIPDSLAVDGGGSFGYSGQVITWTGAVNNGVQVMVSFEAVISDDLAAGTEVTNTAVISYEATLIERSASTSITGDTSGFVYLPILDRAVTVVSLLPIERPNVSNQWTLYWWVLNGGSITGYDVEEATHPDFSDATIIEVGPETNSLLLNPTASPNNIYYYRVRAVGEWGFSEWSNTESQVGHYRDDFDDDTSGWAMRRQDTDTVVNQVYYRNGNLVLEMDSGYDYQIAASMRPAPDGPYRIDSSIRLVGVDNLHSYGLIFGGDWNGQACPNGDYSSCFNHYYRLNVIWSGNLGSRMTMQFKRIDYHDPDDNAGRGPTLIGPKFVNVNSPAQDYQLWSVEVYPDGLIKIFVNNNLVGEVVDNTYVNDPYFGAFSSVDEYTGIEAEFDWYLVKTLP